MAIVSTSISGSALLSLVALAALLCFPAAPSHAQVDCLDPRPSGVTLCGEAALWEAENPSHIGKTFDEFVPGLVGSGGCIAGPPGPTLPLAIGSIAASSFDAVDTEVCALLDGSSASGQVSDGYIPNQGRFEMQFSPPTMAFFTYFGSLAMNQSVAFELFDENDLLVDAFSSFSSVNDVDALGYGFWSTVPIARIVFTSSENGTTLVGAFVRLHSGAGSLGTTRILGYEGPDEGDGIETIERDFGVMFDCNDNGIADPLDISGGASQDIDADGWPDECEACPYADDDVDCNGNGTPDGCEPPDPQVVDPSDPQYASLQDAIYSSCSGDQVVVGAGQSVLASPAGALDLNVEPASLVLEEGATLEFQAGGKLRVGPASLVANGTALAPVSLTTQGGGSPANRWGGVHFTDGSSGSLSHVQLAYTNDVGIRIDDASPTLEAVEILDVAAGVDAAAAGILVTHPNAAPTVANTTVLGIVGGPGSTNQPGGSAAGIDVDAGTATIAAVHIESVVAGVGGAGGHGQNGFDSGNNGGNGSAGLVGGAGGDAWGIRDQGVPAASIQDAVVQVIQAGAGGNGGNGGRGGQGGEGFQGGNGGNGHRGGEGGTAWGIQSLASSPVTLHQNLIDVVQGAAGGDGGEGGDGGLGDGGSFSFLYRGDGGDGGRGGSGGWGLAIELAAPTGATEIAQNTVVGTASGSIGAGGLGGVGALNGTPNSYPPFPTPTQGSTYGFLNAGGAAADVANNVFVGTTASSYDRAVGKLGGGPVAASYNCWDQYGGFRNTSQISTDQDIQVDPLFSDPDGADDMPGNADDDLRLASGSPCIDSGNNAAVPAGLTLDLDGNWRLSDDPATPDNGAGAPPIVDRGAYELLPEAGALGMLAVGGALLFALRARRHARTRR